MPPDAALEDLQQALLTGLLIDVTDQHLKGVTDANGNHLSPVGVSDDPDARMVFIGSEKHEGVISGPKPLFPWQSLKMKRPNRTRCSLSHIVAGIANCCRE